MTESVDPLTIIEAKIKTGDPKELPVIVTLLAALDDPVTKEAFTGAVVTKFKVPRKTIRQMLQAIAANTAPTINTTVKANFTELIDMALDESGTVVFLTANPLIPEMHMSYNWYDGTEEIFPPSAAQIPYRVPQAGPIIQHYLNDKDDALCKDVVSYLNRFCYITHGQALIASCYVFLTYLQDHFDIHYLAIITLVGEPERGKSRLGKAMAYISYRGIILNGVREAHIIRLAEDFMATLFIDLRAAWKKVIAEKADDLILGRYERGHQVMRVVAPDKGAYADSRFFKVFGPTVIASNEPLEHVLETRCVPLIMANRPGNYEIPQEILGQELRARLVAWRARVLHQPLPPIESIGLSGRFWDITQPILRVCMLLHPEGYNDLCKELVSIATEKTEMKKGTLEALIIQSIQALSTIATGDCQLKLDVLLQGLNGGRSPDKTFSSQFLGLKLKSMGIKTKHIRGHSWIVLEKILFDVLMQQFGLSSIVDQSTVTNHMNTDGKEDK